jgi:hypothetical protein
VGLGAVVHAHEDEGRIEAHGAERADGEALGTARGIERSHDGDSRRELREGMPEGLRIDEGKVCQEVTGRIGF